MASPSPAGAAAAQARWELENGVVRGGPPGAAAAAPSGSNDAGALASAYKWDPDAARAVMADKPWARDPHYFQR
jgi:hypothetical protein